MGLPAEKWAEIKELKRSVPTLLVAEKYQPKGFSGYNRATRRRNGQYRGFTRKAVGRPVRPSGRALTHGQAKFLQSLSESI